MSIPVSKGLEFLFWAIFHESIYEITSLRYLKNVKNISESTNLPKKP